MVGEESLVLDIEGCALDNSYIHSGLVAKSLRCAFIGRNMFSSVGLAKVASSGGMLSNVSFLDLTEAHLTDEDCGTIANGCPVITHLCIRGNVNVSYVFPLYILLVSYWSVT